jgi:exodeoxyribonuclease VII large subunit
MESVSNAPEFSVTELSGAIRRTMEDSFGHVRVRGEITGYRGPHSSGHVYFALKDSNARIEAVIWKGVFARLRGKVDEGLEVIATGKVSTFPGSSKYQIIIEDIEPAGVGALLMQLEERKKRLAAEGLFAAERKKAIPFLPDVIGIVTSPTGAVIRDIIHRVTDRFPRHLIVWPVRVQGETSAEEVRSAIMGFNDLTHDGAIPRPDVLIVARGGGSLEDLWGFNDEALARTVAASDIPLIAAVGHETDNTLIDFVADIRAPTPTAAAERAVPVRAELIQTVEELGLRLRNAARRGIERKRVLWQGLVRGLPQAESLLAPQRQRLDFASQRLPSAARQSLDQRLRRLAGLQQRLISQSPRARLGALRERLSGLDARLRNAMANRVARERQLIERQKDRLPSLETRLRNGFATGLKRRSALLEARFGQLRLLGHGSVLARGYAIVKDMDGGLIRSAGIAAKGAAMTLVFADGETPVRPLDGASPQGQQRDHRQDRPQDHKPAPRKAARGSAAQGDLF